MDRLACIGQQAPSLLQFLLRLRNVFVVVTIHPRLQPLNLPLVNLVHDTVATDTCLDGVEKLVEGASAEQLDVLARRTDAREDVVVVGYPVRLKEDVVTGKTQHLAAVATLAK